MSLLTADIKRKCFRCPLWEMWKFSSTQDYDTLLARALLMLCGSHSGKTLHIMPSVKCYK